DLGRDAVRAGRVAGLLVTAPQVADDAPAPVEVDAARGALGEHDDEHVVPPVGVGVDEVPDGPALVGLLGPGRDRIGRRDQSNHCRITAAAAARLGLDCTIVLTSPRPSTPTGNVLLDEVLRPDIVWAGERDYYGAEAAIEDVCLQLAAQGRRPYRMPVGGAS